MGLDMYLKRKTYIPAFTVKPELQTTMVFEQNPCGIQAKRVKEITEEMCHWRKFNALHEWFVKHVQQGNDDCGTYVVSPEDLRNLLKTLEAIKKNKNRAKEMLPPKEGFFFGSTEIDDYYFENVDDSIFTIKSLLAEPANTMSDLYYHSSW